MICDKCSLDKEVHWQAKPYPKGFKHLLRPFRGENLHEIGQINGRKK